MNRHFMSTAFSFFAGAVLIDEVLWGVTDRREQAFWSLMLLSVLWRIVEALERKS